MGRCHPRGASLSTSRDRFDSDASGPSPSRRDPTSTSGGRRTPRGPATHRGVRNTAPRSDRAPREAEDASAGHLLRGRLVRPDAEASEQLERIGRVEIIERAQLRERGRVERVHGRALRSSDDDGGRLASVIVSRPRSGGGSRGSGSLRSPLRTGPDRSHRRAVSSLAHPPRRVMADITSPGQGARPRRCSTWSRCPTSLTRRESERADAPTPLRGAPALPSRGRLRGWSPIRDTTSATTLRRNAKCPGYRVPGTSLAFVENNQRTG